jgi:hypothetical protein
VFAGSVRGTGSINGGSGFTSRRLGSTAGSYRIQTGASWPSIVSVSAVPINNAASMTSKVIQVAKQSDGSYLIDFEFRNGSGTMADSDFIFIVIQTS